MKIDTTVMAMATDVAAKAHPSCSSRTDQAAAKMAKTATQLQRPGHHALVGLDLGPDGEDDHGDDGDRCERGR